MYAASPYDIREVAGANAPAARRLPQLDSQRRSGPSRGCVTAHRIYLATIAGALVWALMAPATSSAYQVRSEAGTSSLAGTTSQQSQEVRAAAVTSSLAGTTAQQTQEAQYRGPATTNGSAQDLRSPDTRDAAIGRGPFSVSRTTNGSAQDLRSPDTRDAAIGRGPSSVPDVTVVKLAQPAPTTNDAAIDWRDAGIGAGTALVLIILALAGATAITHRRRPAPRPATGA
jgi:hypothetical protein